MNLWCKTHLKALDRQHICRNNRNLWQMHILQSTVSLLCFLWWKCTTVWCLKRKLVLKSWTILFLNSNCCPHTKFTQTMKCWIFRVSDRCVANGKQLLIHCSDPELKHWKFMALCVYSMQKHSMQISSLCPEIDRTLLLRIFTCFCEVVLWNLRFDVRMFHSWVESRTASWAPSPSNNRQYSSASGWGSCSQINLYRTPPVSKS